VIAAGFTTVRRNNVLYDDYAKAIKEAE